MSDNPEKTKQQAAENSARLRAILSATLAATPENKLLHAAWAVRAIQSDQSERGLKLISGTPNDACTSDISSKHSIHPWELELLVNERLSIHSSALFLVVNPLTWQQMAGFVNLVREIEGDEYIENNEPENIIDYMFKISSRQFEWQQGFLTFQEVFRSTFVYGQGACADFFKEKYGISVNDFTATCFGYFSMFTSHPQAPRDLDLRLIGITKGTQEKALNLISRHIRQIKSLAQEERLQRGEMAYKPSVLRKYPLIGMTAKSQILCCPLPELLINRMTFGLFYDVIGGGGPIRDEIGKNFESYCHTIIAPSLQTMICEKELSYGSNQGEKRSPDIIISDSESNVVVLLECKAGRMPIDTRYSNFSTESRGYQDMVKGVTQIWRFVADVRMGLIAKQLHPEIVGSVLTLDSWFVSAPNRQKSIISEAVAKCERNYPNVQEEDRIPISFVYMPELERALAYGTEEQILRTFSELSSNERMGYSFDIALREVKQDGTPKNPFPFDEEMSSILPWWGRIRSMSKS